MHIINDLFFPCLLSSYVCMNVSGDEMCLGMLLKSLCQKYECHDLIKSVTGNCCDRPKKSLTNS